MIMRKSIKSLLLIASAVMTGTVFAQPVMKADDGYPTRPIKLIVPYSVGGTTDVLARLVSSELSPLVGQPVVVENRPGGATMIAANFVRRADPDGYTLFMGVNTTFSSNPFIYKNLTYSVDDFSPVALVGKAPMVLSTSVKNPVDSLEEMVSLSQSKDGGVSFATIGKGSSVHLMAELIAMRTGMKMTPIPYNGSGPAINALMANDIDLYADAILTSLPLLNAKSIKPLAISSSERSPLLPDVPTFEEAGIKNGTAYVWFGILAPSGVSADTVTFLNKAINKVLESPKIKERLRSDGIISEPLSPSGFKEFMNADAKVWSEVIRAADIQLD